MKLLSLIKYCLLLALLIGTQAFANPQSVIAINANGHGSTGTVIRTYGSLFLNLGTNITYTSDAVNGDYFTINNTGMYSITRDDGSTATGIVYGISKNASSLTASIDSLTYAQGFFGEVETPGASTGSQTSRVAYLLAGDIIRAHDRTGVTNNTGDLTFMAVTRIDSNHQTNSMMVVSDGNGYGSTGTKIRRYSTVRINNGGADITYTPDAVNGDRFTVNTSGVYTISRADNNSTTPVNIGFSVNASSLTTNCDTLTWANGARGCVNNNPTYVVSNTMTLYLTAGDVVRAHDSTVQCDATSEQDSWISISRNN